ncbi:MAG: hypothetical protein ACLP0J_27460 [Solirubrobacteraceae bacterium]
MANTEPHLALGDVAARQLANAQKTRLPSSGTMRASFFPAKG